MDRSVHNIPVQIHIFSVEAEGVGLEEAAQRRRVEAVTVVVEGKLGEVFAAGEEETVGNGGGR